MSVTSLCGFLGSRPPPPPKPPAKYPLGFSFSPAGLLLPYHVGVAEYLNHHKILNPEVPVCGSSAGAIAIVCSAVKLSAQQVIDSLQVVEENIRQQGTARRLYQPVLQCMEALLPENSHELIREREAPVTVNVQSARPWKPLLIDQFTSKQDLRDCVLASCNIPLYFSGGLTMKFRGQRCLDGYFTDRKNFGCPDVPDTHRTIRVMPWARRQMAAHLPPHDVISPDLELMDPFIDPKEHEKFEKYLMDNPVPIATNDNPQEHGKLGAFDFRARFRRSLTPALTPEEIWNLYNDGRRDAFRWLHCEAKRLKIGRPLNTADLS